jgi:hypothetical protein
MSACKIRSISIFNTNLKLKGFNVFRIDCDGNATRTYNAATRITAVFLELLERQFPVESPHRPLQLKTAQDYAASLSLHTNHLNHAVKEVTGKPTTAHISERIISEAKALLQHTD